MGRYYDIKKTEADGLKNISVSFLNKHGYFETGWKSGSITWTYPASDKTSSIGVQSFISDQEKYLELQYTQTDSFSGVKTDFDYRVSLVTTECNFGGQRYWFICPLSKNSQYCGKRIGVLFKGNGYFGCRHCYDLSYKSKNENRRYKNYHLFQTIDLFQKAEKIEDSMKRYYYAGKPTKKFKKLDKVESRIAQNAALLRLAGEI